MLEFETMDMQAQWYTKMLWDNIFGPDKICYEKDILMQDLLFVNQ